jgi:hypothetical protein
MTELRMLKVQDVDVNARNGRVTGKYGKTRVVLLTQRAADALRTYIAGRTIGYVFQQDYPLQTGTFAESGGVWIARWKDYAIDRPRYTYPGLTSAGALCVAIPSNCPSSWARPSSFHSFSFRRCPSDPQLDAQFCQ